MGPFCPNLILMVFKVINSNFYGKLLVVFLCYLLVTYRYLIVTSGYLVVTPGYLIAISGYFWLRLVTSRYFWFLVLVTTSQMCVVNLSYTTILLERT